MAIRDITYLKSRFENGDTPDQVDFGDLLDTMFSLSPPIIPLVIEIKGIILVDPNDPANNLDFEFDVCQGPADFGDGPYLLQAKSKVSTSGWEYWNGVSMQPMPLSGLNPAYQNEDVGLVTYTWTGASRGIVYYYRYRSGFSDNWGDWRVGKTAL
jgi:hypothetical protein